MDVGFLNVAEHGVYLEGLWVDDPKNTPLDMFVPPPPPTEKVSFGTVDEARPAGTWVPPDRLLPQLLAAGVHSPTLFKLRLTDDTPSGKNDSALARRDAFKLGYKVSQLDKAKWEDKNQLVRLRREGASKLGKHQ